jgi:hypothetical protein
MKLNRKTFLASLGAASIVPLVGCKTPGVWTESETQKLALTLEQAGLVLSRSLNKDPKAKEYLTQAVTALELVVADGKLDPSDVAGVVLKYVKNDNVVIAIYGALTIYNIWWIDNPASTTYGVTLIAALTKGIKNGMVDVVTSRMAVEVKPVVARFKSTSLDNAVQDFFKKYDKVEFKK